MKRVHLHEPLRCEAMTAEQHGYRSQCTRTATAVLEGHALCTQHGRRALRRRVVWLVDGTWFQVAA